MKPNYAELFSALSPEAALFLGALLVLTLDLTIGRKKIREARWDASVRLALFSTPLPFLYISPRFVQPSPLPPSHAWS